MKTTLCILCALATLLIAGATPAAAASAHYPMLGQNMAACQRISPEATSPLPGRQKKKRASSAPAKLNRQLHQNQTQLKSKAQRASKFNWKRCKKGF